MLAGIPALLFTFIPGILLAMPLLKTAKLTLFEKLVFGIILGIVVPPFALFLLELVGVPFTFGLAVGVNAVIALAALAWGFVEGAYRLPETITLSFDLESTDKQKQAFIWVALSLIMLWAFWARIQSLSPYFYEFDPYYYLYSTMDILTKGDIPVTDMTGWYPQGSTHRLAPMTNYLGAEWYSFMTMGGAYDRDTLSMVGNIYPPLVGALLCFLLYIFIKEEYGAGYGLIAALFGAVLPHFIEKFAAGEAEVQPWGLFALFFFAASYALMAYRKDWRLAVLSGIAAISVINGSQYSIILSLVYGGYLGIQATLDFLRGKELREFLKLNGIVVGITLLGYLAMVPYVEGYPITVRSIVLIVPYLFAAGLQFLTPRVTNARLIANRVAVVAGLGVLGLAVLFITPLGGMIYGYVQAAAGFAGHPEALYMTVAEESPTEGQLTGAFDTLGATIAPGFTLIHLTLILAVFGLLYGIWRDSRLAIFIALMIYPISYVGMSKSKYLLQLGLMLVLALAVIPGELDKLLRGLIKDTDTDGSGRRNAHYVVLGVFALFAAYTFLEPGMATIQTPSGGTADHLRLNGAVPELLTTTTSPAYWMNSTRTLSNGTNITEYKANCTALSMDGFALTQYLECNVIPDWWLAPMDWMTTHVENDTRVVSWWDYGHWTNYFGNSNTLTRNEHVNTTVDLMVADKFVFGARDNGQSGEADLAAFMQARKAKYAMFDYDLIQKWGALNFLACVYNNETNQSFAEAHGIGTSQCEAEHSPEMVYIPRNPSVNDHCTLPADPSLVLIRARSTFGRTYCVYLSSQQATYGQPLAMFYADNMSRQNTAELAFPRYAYDSAGQPSYIAYMAAYFNDSSWADRPGKFYDSNFYKAYFLGSLSGFTQVFPAQSSRQIQMVRIYELNNYAP